MNMAESQLNKMRVISLIVQLICNVVFILLLPLSLILAIGTHGPLFKGTKLVIVWSFPIMVPISIIGSWIFYRQQSYGKAISLSFLPLLSIIGLMIVGLLE